MEIHGKISSEGREQSFSVGEYITIHVKSVQHTMDGCCAVTEIASC